VEAVQQPERRRQGPQVHPLPDWRRLPAQRQPLQLADL